MPPLKRPIMIKLDIFQTPASLPGVAPVGAPWVDEHLEASHKRSRAWNFSISSNEVQNLNTWVEGKLKTFNDRFNEALDNMIVVAVERGMDLAVSGWIRDDMTKSYRREFALISPGDSEIPFGAPCQIYQTSKGWPNGKDPRFATKAQADT
jgi:hypothetical protein